MHLAKEFVDATSPFAFNGAYLTDSGKAVPVTHITPQASDHCILPPTTDGDGDEREVFVPIDKGFNFGIALEDDKVGILEAPFVALIVSNGSADRITTAAASHCLLIFSHFYKGGESSAKAIKFLDEPYGERDYDSHDNLDSSDDDYAAVPYKLQCFHVDSSTSGTSLTSMRGIYCFSGVEWGDYAVGPTEGVVLMTTTASDVQYVFFNNLGQSAYSILTDKTVCPGITAMKTFYWFHLHTGIDSGIHRLPFPSLLTRYQPIDRGRWHSHNLP